MPTQVVAKLQRQRTQDLESEFSPWFCTEVSSKKNITQFTFALDLNFRELENERADKSAAFQRTRVLEGRLQTESERIQIESEIGQKVEAALSKLLQDYQDLVLQISVSSKELAMLRNSFDMLEKENTGKRSNLS